MNRKRTGQILVVTLTVLILVACLPGLVGICMDVLILKKPETAPITPIELNLGTEDTIDPGRMFQKLALERNMQLIPVTQREATKTPEEIYEAVEEQMKLLTFFQWFDYTKRTAEPHLALDPEDSDNYAIIWVVDYASKEPYHNLFLHVDDATGAILKIDYYTHENLYPQKEQHYLFEEWCSVYFDWLGLGMSSEYVQSLDVSWSELNPEKDSTRITCHMQEIQYGIVNVSFTVKPGGFFISFTGTR